MKLHLHNALKYWHQTWCVLFCFSKNHKTCLFTIGGTCWVKWYQFPGQSFWALANSNLGKNCYISRKHWHIITQLSMRFRGHALEVLKMFHDPLVVKILCDFFTNSNTFGLILYIFTRMVLIDSLHQIENIDTNYVLIDKICVHHLELGWKHTFSISSYTIYRISSQIKPCKQNVIEFVSIGKIVLFTVPTNVLSSMSNCICRVVFLQCFKILTTVLNI